MFKFFDDYKGFIAARAALPYVAYVTVLLACGTLVVFPSYVHDSVIVGAKFMGVGASTALFTRFLGGMGLFKDAISDVLGGDKWLDRRNDLEDLWIRITRRIFLPGFVESDDASASQFLEALNKTMTQTLLRPAPNTHHSYYGKDAVRTITIRWKDQAAQLIEIVDALDCSFVVFGKMNDEYTLRCFPTSGATIADYNITIKSATLDKKSVLESSRTDSPFVLRMPLMAGSTHSVSREILFCQNVVHDPIYVVTAGHVVWGMIVTIINEIPELSLNWEETGMRDVFEKMKFEVGIQLRTKQVLLPTQGIYLVLTSPPAMAGTIP